MNGLLSTTQLGELLGVTRLTVHEWALKGKIPHRRLASNHMRFRPADVVKALRERGATVPAALLARCEDNPLAAFSVEELESEIATRKAGAS